MPAADTEARRLFLESGVPECVKRKMDEQKNSSAEECVDRGYRFPKETHVRQAEAASWAWNLETASISAAWKPVSDNDRTVPRVPAFSSLVSLVSSRQRSVAAGAGAGQPQINVAAEIASLKKQEPDVNVGDVYASVKKLGGEKAGDGDGCAAVCWTEKYKPAVSSDVIGNATNLLKLKEWIESHKRTRDRLSEDDGSSDEFVDSDDSSRSSDNRNNVALVVGPPGCGKTCAVYSLANELGFKVLEVNAASNRNGKRILDELQEATQSHRVKRSTIFDKDVKKSKKKKKDSNNVKKTMSLILIEDADILFENYDEGFLSALSSLTLHSKRPFIFTMNNINRPHLTKYNNGQNLVLIFTYPKLSLLNVWLQSVAFNEGVKLSDEILMYLFHVAGLDLRKSLLQLQMLISSKKFQCTLDSEQRFYTDWWKRILKPDGRRVVSKLANEASTTPIKLFSDDDEKEDDDDVITAEKSSVRPEETQIVARSKTEKEADAKALKQLASLFEKIAFLGSLEAANSNHSVIVPGEETESNRFTSNFYHSQLNDDIAEAIKTRIFNDDCVADSSFSFKEYYKKIRISKDIEQIVDDVFYGFNPKPSNTFSKYCDYLPAIRDIARIESTKVSGQRRTGRYFSYLNSINVHISEKETNFLSRSLL